MTIKEEILAELRKGTPIKEVNNRFRSKSALYEALREHHDYFIEETTSTQKKLQAIEDKLYHTKNELQHLSNQKKSTGNDIQNLLKQKKELEKDNTSLERQIKDNNDRLSDLESSIKELKSQGLTPEIIQRIKNTEFKTGQYLLERVKTAKDYSDLQKGFNSLKHKTANLIKDVNYLKMEKKKFKEQIQIEHNKLDELKIKTSTFKEAINTVVSFFSDRYNTKDIKRLKGGLDLLKIKDNPTLSIDRLIKGLEDVKTLSDLNDVITEKKIELDTIQKNMKSSKAKLNAIKETILPNITTTKNAAINSISETRNESIKKIDATEKATSSSINKIAQYFEKKTDGSLAKIDSHLSVTMQKFRDDFEEWGNLQQKIGECKQPIKYGYTLLGVLENPDEVQKLPLDIITRLTSRILLWITKNLPDTKVKASENIHNKEYILNTMLPIKLPVLAEFLKEALEEKTLEIKLNEYQRT
ncbi:MAG: hypothetical protein NWE90_07520 [Candidatus Bathyarchaeota archaeon]|nr:hypothetical protein [Candidatus Bathyarchaeota archaeon]